MIPYIKYIKYIHTCTWYHNSLNFKQVLKPLWIIKLLKKRMLGWTDGMMEEGLTEWWKEGWMDGGIKGRMEGWKNKEGWMDGQMNGWRGGWMDGFVD